MKKILYFVFMFLFFAAVSCTEDENIVVDKDDSKTEVTTPPEDGDKPSEGNPSEDNPSEDNPSENESGVYYVCAQTGSDSRSAKEACNPATPWKTIQHAVDRIPACCTLTIRPGTYYERVVVPSTCSGTAEKRTVIRAEEQGTVVIDDRNDGNTERYIGVFHVDGVNYLTLSGLKVQNSAWYGFLLENADNLVIEECATFNSRASGIMCKYCTNLKIVDNEIRKACQETERDKYGGGSHECITVSRTNDYLISRNEIWGSDVPGNAGGEGIDSKGCSFNGEISFNYIHDIQTLGIYVDAGSGDSYNIRVHSNKLVNTSGLSVAGELGGRAYGIYFYNNVIVNSATAGMTYQNIQNGCLQDIYVVNNTFVNTNMKGNFGGEISSYSKNTDNRNHVVKNNIFYNPQGKQRFSIWHDYAKPYDISHNAFYMFKPGYSAEGNQFRRENLTENDVVDIDPKLADPENGNYVITSDSPCKWAGIPIYMPDGKTLLFDCDIDGKKREEGKWSMGAYELTE